MSDDYQLRRDVDRLIDDIYGVNSKIVSFAENSDLRGVHTRDYKEGTIDALFQYFSVPTGSTGNGEGSIDLSNYVKKSDVSFSVSLESNGTMIFNLNVGD